MQSISLFLDITNFRGKNADISRTQKVCHVSCMFLDVLQVSYNCAKFNDCRICVSDFREGTFPPSTIREQPQKRLSLICLNTSKVRLDLFWVFQVVSYSLLVNSFFFSNLSFFRLHFLQTKKLPLLMKKPKIL